MCLSFDKKLLAEARSNHQIEIWQVNTFSQILVIAGHKNVDVRNIHWVEPDAVFDKSFGSESNVLYYARQKAKKLQQKKRRLITTGLNGLIIEWDLLNCKPLQKC